MKVIFLVKSIYPFHGFGGAEKYVYDMARHLVNRKIDVEIVAPIFDKTTRSKVIDGINYTFLPPNITHFGEFSFGRILEQIFGTIACRYLLRTNFDILHGVEFAQYPYLRKKNRRPVFFHLFYDTYRQKPVKGKLYFLKKPLIHLFKTNTVKYCLKNADRVVTETDFQSDEMSKMFHVEKSKMFDLPVAIDINKISMANNPKITRESLKLGKTDFVAISVNRLVPEKGIDTLVDSFSIVLKTLPTAKMIIIGTGYQEDLIKSKIRHYQMDNSVFLIQNVSEGDLYEYYRLSDVYLSPTLQDDYIMSIQEAMAIGLAIISTGQRWVVKEGINGHITEKRNPEMMANKIIQLYQSGMSSAFGKKSKELIAQYDWQFVINKLISHYENVLKTAGK